MTSAGPPHLDTVQLREEGNTIHVQLSGNWPTPAWNHDETKVEIDKKQRLVRIHYYGHTEGGLVMQVLEPFTASIDIKLPSKGEWTFEVEGKTGKIVKTIKIS